MAESDVDFYYDDDDDGDDYPSFERKNTIQTGVTRLSCSVYEKPFPSLKLLALVRIISRLFKEAHGDRLLCDKLCRPNPYFMFPMEAKIKELMEIKSFPHKEKIMVRYLLKYMCYDLNQFYQKSCSKEKHYLMRFIVWYPDGTINEKVTLKLFESITSEAVTNRPTRLTSIGY